MTLVQCEWCNKWIDKENIKSQCHMNICSECLKEYDRLEQEQLDSFYDDD